jgi:AcrR family transcriptional regulator
VVKRLSQTATDTTTRILDAAVEIFVRRGIDGAGSASDFAESQ